MKLKGRRTALAAVGLGLVLLTAALAAFRKDLLVEWHLRRLAEDPVQGSGTPDEGPGEVESLRIILQHKPKSAQVILGLIQKHPDAGSRLLDALQSLAASDPAALSVLVEIAREAPDESTRREASFRLDGAPGAALQLIDGLSLEVSRWVGTVSVDTLVARAWDRDPLVRQAVLADLGLTGSDSGVVLKTVSSALADEEPLVRRAAARAIWDLRDRGLDASAAIPHLIQAIEDPRFDDGYRPELPADGEPPGDAPRVAAIRALGSMDPRNPRVIPALLKFLEEGSPPVRRAAAQAILDLTPYRGGFCGTCGLPPPGPEMFPAFAGAYQALLKRPPLDGDPPAREDAPDEAQLRSGMVDDIAGFAAREGPVQAAARKLLLEALRDPVAQGRARVADCLGALSDTEPGVIPSLSTAMEDSDAEASLAAARALAQIGANDTKATEALLEKLRSPRESVRATCARVLEEVGGDPAVVVPALTRLLHDPSSPARALAAETLGFYAHTAESAMPDLTRLLENEDRTTREAAASALEKIRKASD